MLVYRKREADRAHFEKPEDMSGLLHALLIARGISTREEAERFLNPGEAALNDPMLLNDMGRAVERLRAALNA